VRRLLPILLSLFLLPLQTGCEWYKLPWYFKAYEHPTYHFSLRIPRSWKIEQSGVLGAQVIFIAPEKDLSFRANGNVVVQRRDPKRVLKEEAFFSAQQLHLLMNEYQLLSEAPTKLGNLPAHEIRGKYRATEGSRILRTVMAYAEDREYIFTFTCREERELAFQPVINEMIRSFRPPGSLSDKP
jgi:hypothetical protein